MEKQRYSTVCSITAFPVQNFYSIMQGPEEEEAGLAQESTCHWEGGQAACSCTAVREQREQHSSGSGYRGGFLACMGGPGKC